MIEDSQFKELQRLEPMLYWKRDIPSPLNTLQNTVRLSDTLQTEDIQPTHQDKGDSQVSDL